MPTTNSNLSTPEPSLSSDVIRPGSSFAESSSARRSSETRCRCRSTTSVISAEIDATEKRICTIATTLPSSVVIETSPYPTVVAVTMQW